MAALTTICTRRCLDLVKAANRARVVYVGTWLPEPLLQDTTAGDDSESELAASLQTAFLLVLQRLSPKERAAYLLHEVFDTPYDEVARMLELKQPACRQLVARAKNNLQNERVRFHPTQSQQSALLDAFQSAVQNGDAGPLASILAAEVRLTADGGGKVPAVLKDLSGVDAVATFITRRLNRYWRGFSWDKVPINGTYGAIIRDGAQATASLSFAYDKSGKVTNIYIVRNPEKLAQLRAFNIH
ncbi:MAG: sigma factor-like helix-turn-helix DNA-binding protein [Pseudomonadota bacterium]